MGSSSLAIDIEQRTAGTRKAAPDEVAVEEPLEIRLGYATPEGRAVLSLSITMRTPGLDRELAAGFLLSESIVKERSDILSIDYCGSPGSRDRENVIRVELASHVDFDPGRFGRHFYTSSSCGVCGKASLDALHALDISPATHGTPRFRESVLISIPDKLRAAQATFATTGGLHAASAFTPDGELVLTCEDVGRHNAVDKVIGGLLLDDAIPAAELGLMVSGRASFELVQKALTAGMPLLTAISAPSSLAVELANEFDMTLVGFLRGETFNIYADSGRLVP